VTIIRAPFAVFDHLLDTDSALEEDVFEPPVPLGSNPSVSTGFAGWRGGRSLFRKASRLRGGPPVRIRLPPAVVCEPSVPNRRSQICRPIDFGRSRANLPVWLIGTSRARQRQSLVCRNSLRQYGEGGPLHRPDSEIVMRRVERFSDMAR
jgi:hypothetical protein